MSCERKLLLIRLPLRLGYGVQLREEKREKGGKETMAGVGVRRERE